MKNIVYILLILTLSFSANGQVRKSDLVGQWQTDNTDSLYYKSDTIKLYEDINHFLISEICQLIHWDVEKRIFKTSNSNACTEPVYISSSIAEEKLQLTNTDFGQVISLKRNNQLFDKFKITDYIETHVDRYPHDIKELHLMRFDELTEQKLSEYIDSLTYKVLDYDSTIADTTHKCVIRDINTGDRKIVEVHLTNPEPLIILNGHVIIDKEILKQFLLVETKAISYLTKEKSESIHGQKALNGVIVLLVSERRFKKVWGNYGRSQK